jgi:hypothetical protein
MNVDQLDLLLGQAFRHHVSCRCSLTMDRRRSSPPRPLCEHGSATTDFLSAAPSMEAINAQTRHAGRPRCILQRFLHRSTFQSDLVLVIFHHSEQSPMYGDMIHSVIQRLWLLSIVSWTPFITQGRVGTCQITWMSLLSAYGSSQGEAKNHPLSSGKHKV